MSRPLLRWAALGLGAVLLAGVWLLIRRACATAHAGGGGATRLTLRRAPDADRSQENGSAAQTVGAAPHESATVAEGLLLRLRAFLREGNTDDDRLISILVAYSQLLLKGDADAVSRLHDLLTTDPPDEAILPYLVVLRALCADTDAFADIEGCIFRSKGIAACYAIDSLMTLASPRVRAHADDAELLKEFWTGVLLDRDGGKEMRPGYAERRGLSYGISFSSEVTHSEIWASTLKTPTDARTRAVFVRAAMADIPELARVNALMDLESGRDADATARALLTGAGTPRWLRSRAPGMLTPGPEARALLLGLVDRETDPIVLANMAVHLCHVTDRSDAAEIVQALERMAARGIDNAGLADRIASALSVLDTPESVAALSGIIEGAPSTLYRLQAIVEICDKPECSTRGQRVEVLSTALWQVDPKVAARALTALLFLGCKPQWADAVAKGLDQRTLDRMRQTIELVDPAQDKGELRAKLDALQGRK